MSNDMYTDEKLNLFIDNELDFDEIDEIHQAILKDKVLGSRVCQLKAVRELVRYAYQTPPESALIDNNDNKKSNRIMWQSIAASMLMIIGVSVGWLTNDFKHSGRIVSAAEVFDYFKFKSEVDRTERRIVIHVTTGDVAAVNGALNEVEQLLASYSDANSPMQLDIVTFRDGINMLRVDSSPYLKRVESLLDDNENVAIYACKRSINKAEKRWGKEVVLMPQTITTKTAKELVSERIQKGWVYIKV